MIKKDKIMMSVLVVVLLLSTTIFTMIEMEKEETETMEDGTADATLSATNTFLASGENTMITAEALHANLNDGYAGNDPFILSVRSESQYAIGHIPGAVNIPWTAVFTEENLSKLPMNKQIVVCCFTGHTASQVTAMLNVMGYDAVCLKWGMVSWTTNATVAPSYYDPANVGNYPVVVGTDAGDVASSIILDIAQCGEDDTTATSALEDTGADGEVDLRAVMNNYLAMGKPPAVSATSVLDNLNDGDDTNDPFLLSIRAAAQYAKGHVPGAVNIGFKTLFTEKNLSKLPDDDTQIVVICYTGHTASQATALLNINGYNATALKWGMCGWTTNSTIAPSAYNRGKDAKNYGVIVGTEAGVFADGIIAGKTAEETLLEAAGAYLAGGTKFIKSPDLAALMDDTNESNDPFILSIRGSADYAVGHIPGAINIGFKSLFSIENLSKLPDDDTQIVVVCYTGQSASQATVLLNVLGYNAFTLSHGMCGWNSTIATKCFNTTSHQQAYTTEASTTRSGTRGCEDDDGGSGGTYEASSNEWEILRQAAELYANTATLTITAEAVYNNLNDGYTANDPFILSIRSAEHYNIGHVPGAVSIGAGVLFDEANLATLPTDEQIVVYCYTGQGAGHVAAMLNINGFDAISLRYGMCSWTDDPAVHMNKCYDSSTAGAYQVHAGIGPGEWA